MPVHADALTLFADRPASEVRARMLAYPDDDNAAYYGVSRSHIQRLRHGWGIPPKKRGPHQPQERQHP